MLDPVARELGGGFVGEHEGGRGDVAEVAFNGCDGLWECEIGLLDDFVHVGVRTARNSFRELRWAVSSAIE